LFVPAACLVVLAAAGCAKSGAPASAAQPKPSAPAATTSGSADPGDDAAKLAPDPCALVTKKEAEKIAGTALADPVHIRDTCTYTGPVTGPTAQVEVFVGDGAKKFLDVERTLGHDVKPLAAVGDEAYTEDYAVFLRKGTTWVSIHLVRLEDPAAYLKPMQDQAAIVASRI
jgi:hypothetical protein